MSAITALEDLHEDLILSGQSENRRNEVVQNLTEAIKECLDFFSDNCIQRRTITLYPCEVLVAQHFLTQFGLHLKRVRSGYDKIGTKQTYGVFPNWK